MNNDPYARIREARALYIKRRGQNPDLAEEPIIIEKEDGPSELVWKNEIGYVVARFLVTKAGVSFVGS